MSTPLPSTVTEALRRAAALYPNNGITVHDRRGRPVERRTAGELLDSAGEAARRLAGVGVGPGTPVVVALPNSWQWIDGWLGAALAGGLPIALSPANPLAAGGESVKRLAAVLARLEGRHLLCTPNLRKQIADAGGGLPPDLVALTPAELEALAPARMSDRFEPDPESTAFLQLTSGTTGDSRVVQIPHRAAVHNANAIGAATTSAVGLPRDAVSRWRIVSWLPLYHDMGLVGSLLGSLILGGELDLMPPEAFLGRPQTWLKALGSGQRSASTAPNFGYQFCVEQVPDAELGSLDLAAWGVALVGAEMVRPETLDAFGERFEPAGFRMEAFMPCYGLAEAALAVSFDCAGKGYRTAPVPGAAPDAAESVCLGEPVADTEVWAASPSGERLPEGSIGEIRVRGPGVFAGYLNDPAATEEALRDDSLVTGDLGFLSGGELYITGRIKEILVVRGQNLMPHELEKITEQELGGGGVCRAAAFTVDRGAQGEQIILVAEAPTREPGALRAIREAARRRVGLILGLPIADFVFVPAGKLPRTTSGKVPRQRLRDAYIEGHLNRVEL